MSGDLIIEGLTVEYPSGGDVVRPLSGFDVSIPDGSLALVLGPSGSGKTTLLSCLAGILRPTSGTIHHGDRSVTDLGPSELTDYRRYGVGIVFQSFHLLAALTALDNVALPLRNAGTARRAARERAARLLDDVGLAERVHHLPGQLSGGQQQRVAIARALALDPPLVLADEPTAHLDGAQVETTLRILRRLAVPGRVVVVVTHDDRLLPLADQVIDLVPEAPPAPSGPVPRELSAGEVLFAEGDPSDLIYVVGDGEVEVFRTGPDGGQTVLASFGAGDCFGEMGPLFGLPRSATARARTPARVTGYTVADLRDELGIERLDGLVRRGPVPAG